MGNFFSTDGPLFEGMAYIINIIYVSVLWILFSIPIITIGASSTALYYLVMMGILLVDIRVMGAFGTAVSQTLQFVFIVGICMVSAVMVYALAYIARFTQDVRHILTNSVLMAIRHLPKTLLLVVVLAAAVLGCYLFGLGIVFIPAVVALVDSLILESIFVQYMSKEDREKEALRNHPEQYEYYNRKE